MVGTNVDAIYWAAVPRAHGELGWPPIRLAWSQAAGPGDFWGPLGGPQMWLGCAFEPAAGTLFCKHQHNPFLSTVLALTGLRSSLPEFFSNNFS